MEDIPVDLLNSEIFIFLSINPGFYEDFNRSRFLFKIE
jgi:hypothetical protein